MSDDWHPHPDNKKRQGSTGIWIAMGVVATLLIVVVIITIAV